MKVNIDYNVALDMLMERLSFWTDDETLHKLFEKYYDNMIFGGAFEGCDFDPMIIVDNDWINWTRVCDKNEMREEDISDERVLAYHDGYYLISC